MTFLPAFVGAVWMNILGVQKNKMRGREPQEAEEANLGGWERCAVFKQAAPGGKIPDDAERTLGEAEDLLSTHLRG